MNTASQIPVTVRRCRWCELNTANRTARYFIEFEWQMIFSPHHYFGDVTFTDGICPECMAIEMKKINQTK